MSMSESSLSVLQVPTDSELLLATLKMERCAKLAIPRLPSTFPADIATILGAFSHVPTQLLGALSSPQSACEYQYLAPHWISIAHIDMPDRWPWVHCRVAGHIGRQQRQRPEQIWGG